MLKFITNKFKRNSADPLSSILSTEGDFDLVETILKHLRGRDLLSCLLVNKLWHETISQTEQFSEKVRLVIKENYLSKFHSFSLEDVNLVIESERNYNEISLKVPRKMSSNHLLLLATFSMTTLTTLHLDHHTFQNEIELTNFFGIVEPFIESLELISIKFLRTKMIGKQNHQVNYKFPNLEYLKIKNCCFLLFTTIFRNLVTLKQLSIETEDLKSENIREELEIIEKTKGIQKILLENSNVTKLTLHLDQNDFDNLFIDDVVLNRIRFKLEFLDVGKFKRRDGIQANSGQIRNFCTYFLLSQARTLHELKLNQCYGNKEFLEGVIYFLENLKSLTVGHAELYEKTEKTDDPPIKIPAMNVITNHSIESFMIFSRNPESEVIQKTLLKMLPNLKRLSIDRITQSLFKELIEHNRKLEFIEVDKFLAYDPLDPALPDFDYLGYLKKIKINHEYARNFKDIMRNFVEKNFAKCFLIAADEFDTVNFNLA